MSPTVAARYAWWALRHPRRLGGLLRGASLRDLVLQEDLRLLGIDIPLASAVGLGKADASAPLVARLREHLGNVAPETVLDVGAKYGGFARASQLAFPGTRVFCFEPLPESFARLGTAVVGCRGISLFPCALGAADGEAVLHRSHNRGSSSLLTMLDSHRRVFPGTDYDAEETVPVRSLDGMVRAGEVALEGPVLMKIDVQGFEDRVLDGAAETLHSVDAVIIEMSLVPLYEGQVLFTPLRERLERAGFHYAGEFGRLVSPVTGEACQVDGLFLREGGRDTAAGRLVPSR